MQAPRCGEGCSATTADFVAARRLIAVTGSDTAALATTTAVTIATSITASGSSTATSASATTATTAAAATFGQRGTYRQSSGCENQHEHSESSHVAPPP
jgi:RecB family exonuclease